MVLHVIKKDGRKERFDERKLYATCYYPCIAANLTREEAEHTCLQAVSAVRKLARGKSHVKSQMIFKTVLRVLKKHDKKAAFLYENHRDIS
jgi:transcriptional regulator NrdR family protein